MLLQYGLNKKTKSIHLPAVMQGYWHEYEQFNLKSLNVAVQEIGLALFLVLSHLSHIVKLSIGCPETKTWSFPRILRGGSVAVLLVG